MDDPNVDAFSPTQDPLNITTMHKTFEDLPVHDTQPEPITMTQDQLGVPMPVSQVAEFNYLDQPDASSTDASAITLHNTLHTTLHNPLHNTLHTPLDNPLHNTLHTTLPEYTIEVVDGDDLTQEGKTHTQNGNSSTTGTERAPTHYKATDLISPSSKRHRDALTEEESQPTSGMGSFMERLHNVSDREAAPVSKKPKLDENKNDKGKSFKVGKGGVIGEYLKEKRDEGAVQAGPSTNIDLTADDDDDDDDVQIVSVKYNAPDENREVCLGTISAKVMADRLPAANKLLSKHSENWPTSKMSLRPTVGQERVFTAIDAKGNEFGKLDTITASAIAPMLKAQHLNKLRMVAFTKERRKEPGEQPLQTVSKSLDISLTLYSVAGSGPGIGRHLSQRGIFLYKPLIVDHGIDVVNPQVPNVKYVPAKGNASASVPVEAAGYRARTTEEIRSDVIGMIDRLANTEELPEKEADSSIVTTELMPHQKQALWFLSKHETPTSPDEDPLWKFTVGKNGNKAYYNVITGDELKTVDTKLGGILADQMGLGKTLQILALISSTIEEARAFGRAAVDSTEPHVVRNSGGTLLLCPKSVISNWQEQLQIHMDNSKIKYYMYHGSNRLQDLDELAKYDVVITSYSIAASEFTSTTKNYRALSQMAWYRIVLDEAHMIRNQDTATFKSACALVGTRRWAVTGTPIQNRLDDLGALIKFLKIYPFAAKGAFEKHFNSPFKSGNLQVIDNLRLLVNSVTLRRSKEKIDLPDRKEEIVRLDFSDSEKALYDAFARDAGKKVRAMTRGKDRLKGRMYAHVLVNITRLRLLCAHGKELLSEDDMKVLQGSSYETAIDLGEEDDMEKPALTEEQVYDTFYLLRESAVDHCSTCTENIGRVAEAAASDSDSEDSEAEESNIIGYLTPCLHLVCPDCSDGYWKQLIDTRTADNYAHCPQCEQYVKAHLHPINQKSVEADVERRRNKKKVTAKKGLEYGGPHTKVKALVDELNQSAEESRGLMELGEPPIRSVVFSGWTAYLDLIEIALEAANLGFLRLDGRMSVSQRTKVLETFKTDPSISVILVSIKAGGQGLNFTAANKVYMMEPAWNPGSEMQAIDRVHRLGQKRNVFIKRYIMANSFEEKILELQQKKIQLASLATGAQDKKTDAAATMRSLVSLFS